MHVCCCEASQPTDKGTTVCGCGFFVADGNCSHVKAAFHHASVVVEVSGDTTYRTVGYHIGNGTVVSAEQYGVLCHIAYHAAEAVVVACCFSQCAGEGTACNAILVLSRAYHTTDMMNIGFVDGDVQRGVHIRDATG